MIFPWQKEMMQFLWRLKVNNRLPHALLFAGSKGIGKSEFANHFSQALFCAKVTAEGDSCGNCHACRLIANKTHPSVRWVIPQDETHAIKVDAIRAANDFVQHSSLQGDYCVVLIHSAEKMNINAANALLKTLEEPPSGVFIILISDQWAQLPATILSRCARFMFKKPTSTPDFCDNDMLLLREEWYQALSLLQQKKISAIKIAEKHKEKNMLCLLDLSLAWVMDVIRLQLHEDEHELMNQDYVQVLLELKQKTILVNNIKLMNDLQQSRKQICLGINLNHQLMIESILSRFFCHSREGGNPS